MTTDVKPIPYIQKVTYDTYANLPTTGVKVGDLGYATDRLVLYRWDGTAYVAITIHSSSGLFANIPTAADLPDGSLYYATDTAVLYQVQSTAWASITSVPVSVASGTYTGNDGDNRQITTGFKCSLVIIYNTSTESAVMVPGRTWNFPGAAKNGGSGLHATDGFTVYETADALNGAAATYYYWALSE